jgi:N-acetyl-alpha-D-glucosaminyl L-malate synthase BshA
VKIGISCYPSHGGSGVVATELGMELAMRGHEVHFISYSMPFRLKPLSERIVFHEVMMASYPLFQFPPYTLALAAKMAEVADEVGLDILHAHYAVPHAVCAYLARQVARSRDGLRVVTTLHGTDITLVGSDQSFRSLTRFGIDQSDGVTAVSDFLRRKTVEFFSTERPIEVIPNFVDTGRYAPRPEGPSRERYAKGVERILTHISNFRSSKRAPDAVRVLAAVRRETPAILLMVGDGPERTMSRDVAIELGVDRHVRYLGQMDAVEEILGVSDLFILPSANESFGLAALEAMSTGVPVIGTSAEGLPELIATGETGYLLPVGDVEGMARRSIEVLTDVRLHASMANASRRLAVERYDAASVVPRYVKFYEEILERPAFVPPPLGPPDGLA